MGDMWANATYRGKHGHGCGRAGCAPALRAGCEGARDHLNGMVGFPWHA